MPTIKELFEADNANQVETERFLKEHAPQVLEAIDGIGTEFEIFRHAVVEAKDSNGAAKQVAKWRTITGLSAKESVDLLTKATLLRSDRSDAASRAKKSAAAIRAYNIRIVLALRLSRDYLLGLAEILRFRSVAAQLYVRLQTETAGLIRLFRNHQEAADEWLSREALKKGKEFHYRWNKSLCSILRDMGLWDAYDRSSAVAMHSRLASIAHAFSLEKQPEEHLRTFTLNFIDNDNARAFAVSLANFLRLQISILSCAPKMFPELPQGAPNTSKLADISRTLQGFSRFALTIPENPPAAK